MYPCPDCHALEAPHMAECPADPMLAEQLPAPTPAPRRLTTSMLQRELLALLPGQVTIPATNRTPRIR